MLPLIESFPGYGVGPSLGRQVRRLPCNLSCGALCLVGVVILWSTKQNWVSPGSLQNISNYFVHCTCYFVQCSCTLYIVPVGIILLLPLRSWGEWQPLSLTEPSEGQLLWFWRQEFREARTMACAQLRIHLNLKKKKSNRSFSVDNNLWYLCPSLSYLHCFYILDDAYRTVNWFLNIRYNFNFEYNFILNITVFFGP